MSDAKQRARQEQADRKAQEAATKAYNAASTTPPRPAAPAKRMAKGGVTRGDGCIIKGHTNGKMVAMAYGGKTC